MRSRMPHQLGEEISEHRKMSIYKSNSQSKCRETGPNNLSSDAKSSQKSWLFPFFAAPSQKGGGVDESIRL